jgi:peptidoglycan/xylan/chitin deacetylase (PgdA/CDA1 family)
MSLGLMLNRAFSKIDRTCSRVQLRLFERRGALITIFVHGLFLNKSQISQDWCYPQQRTTVPDLRRMIVYFQSAGYRFVSPVELLDGLDPTGKYALLTFDDGYFNNQLALPLLEQYGVPALFFITAGLVEEGRAHWWDVLYRARRQQGVTADEAGEEIRRRYRVTTDQIESELKRELGVDDFRPVGDVDRVFTPSELRSLAEHPNVFIGNHCWTHAFLPAYSLDAARVEIMRAQQALRQITGKPLLAVCYPYGAWNPGVLKICNEAGFKMGFSTVARKESLSVLAHAQRRMLMGRFGLWGNQEIEPQCEFMRSDLMWHLRYARLVARLKRLAGKN